MTLTRIVFGIAIIFLCFATGYLLGTLALDNKEYQPHTATDILTKDPSIVQYCDYEMWDNTTHLALVEDNQGISRMQNVTNVYKVCYNRDGNTSVIYWNEFKDIETAMVIGSWNYNININQFIEIGNNGNEKPLRV